MPKTTKKEEKGIFFVMVNEKIMSFENKKLDRVNNAYDNILLISVAIHGPASIGLGKQFVFPSVIEVHLFGNGLFFHLW